MISETEAKRLAKWIAQAQTEGATLLCVGHRSGSMLQPALLENVPSEQALSCQEAFGPVAILEPFDDFQARECGNNTCPVGITTHNPKLQAGLDIAVKATRIKNYVDNTLHELEELTVSLGKSRPSQLSIDDLFIPSGCNLWLMLQQDRELRESLQSATHSPPTPPHNEN